MISFGQAVSEENIFLIGLDFFKYSPLKPLGLKFDKKHLSKVLYKDFTFCRDPVTNVAATSN
jgi:hypothetical protein